MTIVTQLPVGVKLVTDIYDEATAYPYTTKLFNRNGGLVPDTYEDIRTAAMEYAKQLYTNFSCGEAFLVNHRGHITYEPRDYRSHLEAFVKAKLDPATNP